MSKQILFGKEAREKLQKGVKIMADAVSVTLGASGKNVMLGDSVVHDYVFYPAPTQITKDGVTVARFVQLDDPFENRGAMLMMDASEKTMQQAGDGTTTTIVLARAIVDKGIELINAGANPMQLKKGIDEAVAEVVAKLKEIAIPMKGDIEKIRQIATVSANNDTEIGNLIADAFKKIGDDGIVDIEEANGVLTQIKIEDGFTFDNGYIHELFVTNRTKHESELIDPYILLYDRPIIKMNDLIPVLNQIKQKDNKPILIICDGMDEEALAFMTMNVIQKNVKGCVVKAPQFLQSKRDTMEDIAAVTGATYLSDQKGIGLESVTLKHLGHAKKVIVGKDSTTIIDGKKSKKEFEDLINSLKMDLVDAENETKKEPIEKRIARLQGGIAVIYVGAPTEVEMKEKKDRVDDAVRATKAAISEGAVAGGGSVFSKMSDGVLINESVPDDKRDGYGVVSMALRSPLFQICDNAGGIDKEGILNELLNSGNNIGYNAQTNKVENLIEAGIIDPAKVLRCSLQNASSIAGMILTSECIICKTL